MSLDKKSTHVRLSPDVDRMLAVLAMLGNKDKAALAGELLEKVVVGEFHVVKRTADDMKLLGIIRD